MTRIPTVSERATRKYLQRFVVVQLRQQLRQTRMQILSLRRALIIELKR